jgi:hypothetical protein
MDRTPSKSQLTRLPISFVYEARTLAQANIIGCTFERTIGPTLTAVSYLGSFPWVDRGKTHKKRMFGGIVSGGGEGTDAIEDTQRGTYETSIRRAEVIVSRYTSAED